METILESLKSISGYPVPLRTFTDISNRRGLFLDDEATKSVLKSSAYKLAKADVMQWVSFAPNVSQGGESYDIPLSDRQQLRVQANTVYGELGDEAYIPESKTRFGYKDNRL